MVKVRSKIEDSLREGKKVTIITINSAYEVVKVKAEGDEAIIIETPKGVATIFKSKIDSIAYYDHPNIKNIKTI